MVTAGSGDPMWRISLLKRINGEFGFVRPTAHVPRLTIPSYPAARPFSGAEWCGYDPQCMMFEEIDSTIAVKCSYSR